MVAYESVWLTLEEKNKLEKFLTERMGITSFTTQDFPDSSRNANYFITVPEVTMEQYERIDQAEFIILQGDWEEEKN